MTAILFLFGIAGGGVAAQTDTIPVVVLPNDSITIIPDSTVISNISELPKDSVSSADSFTQKKKESAIDAQVDYTAQDSIVFFSNGTGFLYGAGQIQYKNINLKSDYIRLTMDSSIIYARGVVDTLGIERGKPEFSEGDRQFTSKELSYNLKTKRAFVRQAVTQEGEGYIISNYTKMNEDRLLLIKDAKYTTCDDHDNPHFYLKISKGKVKTGEYIVAGPSQMYIADMPLPLFVPFGYFPFNKSYSSGLLMPSYADNMQRGLGLVNGGYYFAFNDYVDAELRSEIYLKGTWALRLNSTYLKRYKFRGNISVNYRVDVDGEKDMPDYTQQKNFNIAWTHQQDAKANPYSTFSASVNFSTSGYNRSNINNYYNPAITSQNVTSSSVSFSKRFPRIPSLNITAALQLSQQTRDSTLSMTLPDINISYSSTKPFKRKNPIGNEHWYEKITISYSGAFSNSIQQVKENQFLKKNIIKDWRNGIKHTIPVSATFNLLSYINITPSANYTERWYTRSVSQSWDKTSQTLVRDTTYGFKRVYDFSLGVSASTKIYGFFVPNQKLFGWTKIAMIRHVITPTASFSWQPDFGAPQWKYYGSYIKETPAQNVASNAYLYQEVQYSYYEGSLYGAPGQGKQQMLNFSLDNNLEMKIRNETDTTGNAPYKVISLIDNFSLGTSYNIAADSMKLSNINANLRIKFGSAYTLSLATSFDPYDFVLTEKSVNYPQGIPRRVDKFTWKNGRFPRWSGVGTSFNYNFSNDTFNKLFSKKKGNNSTDNQSQTNQSDDSSGQNQNNQLNNNNNNQTNNSKDKYDSDGYQNVSIPWSIGFNWTFNYGPSVKPEDFLYNKMRYKNIITVNNINLSFNISLGDNWNGTTSIYYDLVNKKFTASTFSVRRNLHCWSMSASFVPFGYFKSYTFHIGVNASMLQDLKYDKRNQSPPIMWY
ncbi:MAG: LPS-assembly protein LptD [Paludibacter sp.]|nr:LPS-assembly protein LptD [Paludibacter sp.]